MEDKIKEDKTQNYLRKFERSVNPEGIIDELNPAVKECGDKVISILKEKELTYVDAYATLEYAYRSLRFMSEYTHL